VLTSANGVERLAAEIHDARAFGAAQVAAIGPATADALRRIGVVADLVPARYVGESLVEAFPAPRPDASSRSVLIARAAVARDVVPDGLRALGWDVEVVDAYATRRVAPPTAAAAAAIAGADAITFTSPSTVTAFLELAGREQLPAIVASIGPVTSAAARVAGIAVDVEATQHSAAGLVAALITHAAGVPRPPRRPTATSDR